MYKYVCKYRHMYMFVFIYKFYRFALTLILCAKANQSAACRVSKVMVAVQETSWHLPSETVPNSNFYFRAVPVDQFSLSVHPRQLLT